MGNSETPGSPRRPLVRFWRWLWEQPKRWFLLGIPVGGFAAFVVGILFWGGFGTVLQATSSLEFCTSCHEMRDNVYQEYKQTIHYQNPMGVRAICSDCHVPHAFFPKILRKMSATINELPKHFLGVIDTREKFQAHRLELAQQVWAYMKSTDSRECRSCHSYEAMALAAQSHSASIKHSPEWRARTGQTCIDCHKGIAHTLPEGL